MSSITINNDTFYRQLRSLWSIENILINTMPLLIERATNIGLRKALSLHLAETDQHKVAIEAICKQLNIEAKGEKDEKIQLILATGNNHILQQSVGDRMDEAIIRSAIKVEEYEISAYNSAAVLAEGLGYKGFEKRLRLTLEEEQQSSTKLRFLKNSLFAERAIFENVDEVSEMKG